MTHFLKRLRAANVTRSVEWGDKGILYRTVEFAGESGELCNVVKKLEREDAGLVGSRASLLQLREEIGDVLITLDRIAAHYGVDLEEATRDKFNATSEKYGLITRVS